MKLSALKYAVLSWVSGLTILILFLLPFHALLTVWASDHLGHYTALRLWKEALLALCILGALYLVIADHKIRFHTLSRRLVWLIISYMIINLVWGLLALDTGDVTAKALGYGLISNLRFLAFFLVVWAVALRLTRLRVHWEKLVLWPAATVILFGLLQVFVLPDNFLSHFGYGKETIPAIHTINNNPDYVRIASTLRGPNPLGAYLIIPISLLVVLMIRKGRNWTHAAFLATAGITLFYSHSRSAWIGAALSVAAILFLSQLSRKTRKLALITAGALVIAGALMTVAFRNSTQFDSFVFHTQDNHKASEITSNEGRAAALKDGWQDFKDEPLGMGPGTAGPASFHNAGHEARISENYFLQVAQETGVIGLVLFLLINLGVAALLYMRRHDPLALSLFAAFIGLTFINMLSHAWTDDTLAYIWWGLAGLAMAPLAKKLEEENEKTAEAPQTPA